MDQARKWVALQYSTVQHSDIHYLLPKRPRSLRSTRFGIPSVNAIPLTLVFGSIASFASSQTRRSIETATKAMGFIKVELNVALIKNLNVKYAWVS